MPNYIYKCTECDHKVVIELAISYDPKVKFGCPNCNTASDKRTMTRRIGLATFPANCNTVFAGDWFKKTYGHDIGRGYEDKVRQAEDRKTLEREFKKETGR